MNKPKFKVGDEVIFNTYNIPTKTTNRYKCTVVDSRITRTNECEYRLMSKIKSPITPDVWYSEERFTEVTPEDEAFEEEFKFDIGDKVSFRNEVYTVERKLHIGLNNYYKVKNFNTKSNHLATILESELTPYTEPETQKEWLISPVDYKYEIGDTVKYRDKEYVVIDRYSYISSGARIYTLNLPCTSEKEYVEEKVLLRYNPEEDSESNTEPEEEVKVEYKFKVGDTVLYKGSTCRISSKYISCEGKKCYSLSVNNTPTTLFVTEEQLQSNVHEFHPVGDSSLVDTLMKGNFKEIDYTHIIDDRDKTSLHPDLMRRALMIPGFNIYDLGMGDLTPVFFDDSTTVMVSQPLSSKSKDEILDNRCLALTKFINDIGDITRNIVVVDNLQFDREPTPEEGELNHFDYLSTDIKLMKKIDYIIFAEGWQNSNGCNIEYQMAKTYGIPMYFA